MPGNVKLGSSNEPDPDPAPYLYVSAETKRADTTKPYDAKKSIWVPDEDGGGFVEAMLQSDDGKKATVLIGHEKRVCKSEAIAQMNPPKFEKCEDMANLTYLNEASVLWNLKSRYQHKLIYVSLIGIGILNSEFCHFRLTLDCFAWQLTLTRGIQSIPPLQ